MKDIDYSRYFWQNDLVRLRAGKEDDWDGYYLSLFDSEARRLLQYEIELPPSIKQVKESAAKSSGSVSSDGRLWFTIETLDGKAVGGVNLNSIDEKNGTFSIGMQILPGMRGKGYGTAAMRILLRYAFCERRLNKYNGGVLEGNIASATMLRKLGCIEEGRRREMIYTDGRYQDEILFGLTKNDFLKNEQKLGNSAG